MPFQSSKSLKAARPLTSRAAQNIANQNHPVPQNQAQNASTCDSARGLRGVRRALRRELQHGLALADHAHLLAGELFDVERVVAQPVHRARELGLLGAQRAQLALDGLHVAPHLPGAHRFLHAEHGQAHREHDHGDGAQALRAQPLDVGPAGLHRAIRVYRERPGHDAAWPSSSSMRSSWLYFAVRSLRATEPVLIWPALTATARSATKVSSVSPERCEMTVPYPARLASSMASSVSVSVPTWLTFTSTALARPLAIPCWMTAGLVTKRSSPTSCTRPPRRRVRIAHPAQSSSPSPSSIDTTG